MNVLFPEEHNDPVFNPGIGWVLIDHALPDEIDAGKSVEWLKDGSVYQWFSGVAVLSTWALIEKDPGEFDWSLMDRAIDYWAENGKEIHLRFSTEGFGSYPGCPDWIFERGVDGMARQEGGPRFPDYLNPEYQKCLKQFLSVFFEKFGSDPRIKTIDLRGYGNFGEWHSGYEYADIEKRKAAVRFIIDAWREANAGRKKLVLSISPEYRNCWIEDAGFQSTQASAFSYFPQTYQEYREHSGFDYSLRFDDIMFRRDGLLGAMFEGYCHRFLADLFEAYRKPLFLELFSGVREYSKGDQEVGLCRPGPNGDYNASCVYEILSYRPNLATPSGWYHVNGAHEFYNDRSDLVQFGHKRIGYRLVPAKVEVPGTVSYGGMLPVRILWENRAMGRCTDAVSLHFRLTDSDGNLVLEQTDEDFPVDSICSGTPIVHCSRISLSNAGLVGKYHLAVQLRRDDGLVIEPAVATDSGWIGSGEVTVGENGVGFTETESLSQQLEANRLYRVSFRYTVTRAFERGLESEQPGYHRLYVKDHDIVPCSEVRWFDRDNTRRAAKTVYIQTRNEPGSLCWESTGGGAMVVEDVQVEPVASDRSVTLIQRNEDTDCLVLNGAAYPWHRARSVGFSKDDAEVVLHDDWHDFLETKPEAVPLVPGKRYTVSFDAVMKASVFQGRFCYCTVVDDETDPHFADRPDFFLWHTQHTEWPVRKSFSFKAPAGPRARLVWGLHNGGQCRISNIVIIDESDGSEYGNH